QTRRETIRALVKRVEIDADEVRVVYKVPPRPFVDGPLEGRLQDRLGGDDPPLRCPLRGGEQGVLLQVTRLQPFPKYLPVHEDVIQQPSVADAIKAGFDVTLHDAIGTTGVTTVWPTKDLVTLIQGIRAVPLQPKAVGVAVGQAFRDGVEA